MQTKLSSLVESLVNVFVGLLISFASQLIIFRAYGIALDLHQNLEIVAWFTLVSVIRSFFVRRLFNWFHHKKENKNGN